MVDTVRDIRTRFLGENRMGSAARAARRDVKGIGDEYDTLRRRVAITNQAIAGVTLGIGGGSAAKTLADLQNQTARLSTLTNTLARDQSFLSNTSRRLSIDISAATAAFSRFNVLEQAGALDAGQSEKFITGLGDAFARFGASAGQQENVIYGLSQAFGQGTVQAQELNQVVEPLPGFLNDIARQAGVTAGEYRNLIKQGGYLSTTFRQDVLGALREYKGTAASLAGNIQQTLTRLSNAYKETLLTLQEPITAGVSQLANALIKGFSIISENSGASVKALQLVGAAIAVTYAGRGLRAVQSFTNEYKGLAQKQIQYNSDITAAYQRNAAETVAAEARKAKAFKEASKQTAKTDLSQADTARDAAAKAAAKAKEAASQAALAKAKKQTVLQEREEKLAVKETTLARAKANESVALQASIVAKANARVAASTDQAKVAQKAANAINKEVVASTRAVSVAENQLATARKQVVTATNAYAKASERTAVAMNKQQVSAASLALAQKVSLKATTDSLSANVAYTASRNAATAAEAAANAVIVKNTLAMKAQSLAVGTARGALKGLSAAYSFMGGGAGVVIGASLAVLAMYRNLKQQTPAVEEARDKIKELEDAYKGVRSGAEGAAGQVTTFTNLMKDLDNNKQLSLGDFFDPALYEDMSTLEKRFRQFFVAATLPFQNAKRENITQQTQKEMERLKIAELRAQQNREAGFAAELEAANTKKAYDEQKRLTAEGFGYAESFAKTALEADTVRKKIAAINAVIKSDDKSLTDEKRKILALGLKGAQEELNKVTGVTKALEDQAEARKKALDQQKTISQSLETELQTIKREFDENDLTLRINLEAKDLKGDALFDAGPINDLIILNAQKREDAITEYQKKSLEKRNSDAESLRKKKETAEDNAFAEQIKRRRALADAAATIGDRQGAINDNYNIKQEELQREYGLSETYRVLNRAAEIDATKATEALKTTIVAEELKKRQELFKVNQVDQTAGVLKNFIGAATKEVGSYISITENMTEAERASAEASNRINRAQFEKNKKFRKSSALIDTFAGANRALAQGGIFGIASAAGIVALGLRNVANINKQSYGSSSVAGSAGYSGGTGGTSTNSTTNSSSVEASSNVFIVGIPGESTSQTIDRYNGFLPQLSKAARTQNVRINDSKLSVSDTALLRAS